MKRSVWIHFELMVPSFSWLWESTLNSLVCCKNASLRSFSFKLAKHFTLWVFLVAQTFFKFENLFFGVFVFGQNFRRRLEFISWEKKRPDVDCCAKDFWGPHSTEVAYLLLSQQPQVPFSVFPRIDVDVAGIYWRNCLEQWTEAW